MDFGVSLEDQLKKLESHEEVIKTRVVAHHNTICNLKCKRVCHDKCGVAFSEN